MQMDPSVTYTSTPNLAPPPTKWRSLLLPEGIPSRAVLDPIEFSPSRGLSCIVDDHHHQHFSRKRFTQKAEEFTRSRDVSTDWSAMIDGAVAPARSCVQNSNSGPQRGGGVCLRASAQCATCSSGSRESQSRRIWLVRTRSACVQRSSIKQRLEFRPVRPGLEQFQDLINLGWSLRYPPPRWLIGRPLLSRCGKDRSSHST